MFRFVITVCSRKEIKMSLNVTKLTSQPVSQIGKKINPKLFGLKIQLPDLQKSPINETTQVIGKKMRTDDAFNKAVKGLYLPELKK